MGVGTIFGCGSTCGVLFSATVGQAYPSGLIVGSDGYFYGTAFGCGGNGCVFRADASGNFTVLHYFNGTDGEGPNSGVIEFDGNFYGTTVGSTISGGTIFAMDSSGNVTLLHSFSGGSSDGRQGYGGLIHATDGNFYGTTTAGGASDQGTVFRIDASGNFAVLHSFSGPDGAQPYAGLIQGSDAASSSALEPVALGGGTWFRWYGLHFSQGLERHETINGRLIMGWSEMCVPLRHLNRLVPHQLGNRQQIDASHRESAGEHVPQTVPSEISKARFLYCRIKPMFVPLERLPLYVNKNLPSPGE